MIFFFPLSNSYLSIFFFFSRLLSINTSFLFKIILRRNTINKLFNSIISNSFLYINPTNKLCITCNTNYSAICITNNITNSILWFNRSIYKMIRHFLSFTIFIYSFCINFFPKFIISRICSINSFSSSFLFIKSLLLLWTNRSIYILLNKIMNRSTICSIKMFLCIREFFI